jgi:hypothetical protein
MLSCLNRALRRCTDTADSSEESIYIEFTVLLFLSQWSRVCSFVARNGDIKINVECHIFSKKHIHDNFR